MYDDRKSDNHEAESRNATITEVTDHRRHQIINCSTGKDSTSLLVKQHAASARGICGGSPGAHISTYWNNTEMSSPLYLGQESCDSEYESIEIRKNSKTDNIDLEICVHRHTMAGQKLLNAERQTHKSSNNCFVLPSVNTTTGAFPMHKLSGIIEATGIDHLTKSNGPSYNCKNASAYPETLICNRYFLSALDNKLGRIYKSLREASSAEEKDEIKHDQIQWLKEYRNDCSDESCLIDLYIERIGHLKKLKNKALINHSSSSAKTPNNHNPSHSSDTEQSIKSIFSQINSLKPLQLNSDNYDTCGTFLDFGFRYLYCSIKNTVDLANIERITGHAVFLPGGPHGESINLKSDQFGHYNPEFLHWLEDYLKSNTGQLLLSSPLADRLYKNKLHPILDVLYQAHEIFLISPEKFTKLKAYHSSDSSWARKWRIADASNPTEALKQNYLRGIPPHDVAAGFWSRRTKDGTEKQVFKIVKHLLSVLDPNYITSAEDVKRRYLGN